MQEAAIGHDPYAEPLYQQAMRLHAQLGEVEAIRRLRRTLTRRLADIDTESGEDTLALADRLVTDLHRPRRPRPLYGTPPEHPSRHRTPERGRTG